MDAGKSNTKFLICAVGIFFSYFYFAILQEKITRSRYGDELNEDGTRGELYTMALALVFVQCFVNWCFAKGKQKQNVFFVISAKIIHSFFSAAMLIAKPQKEDKTNVGYYASSALTYLLAMVSSNMALRWVPYPTQVVGKSAKPIPVMILGVLIGNKKYSAQKYVCILMIVIGVALFMYKDGKGKAAAANESMFGIGEILLILSLSMDGLTGAIQDRMRASSKPSAQQMMLAMNGWSAIMVAVALLGTGELMEFIAFTSRYPYVWMNLALLALTGAIGQLFIFMMVSGCDIFWRINHIFSFVFTFKVSAYGPLSCSVVTTTRKFFTVLCSVIFFGNVLVTRQWIGAVLVFAGLFADMVMGKKGPAPPPKKTAAADDEATKKLIS